MPEQEIQTTSTSKSTTVPEPWWRGLCRWLWKVSVFLGMAVVLTLGVNVLSTWLTSSKGIIPPDSPFAGMVTNWPLTLAVGVCLLLLAVLTFILSGWPAYVAPSSLTQRNRTYMLQRLRYSYRELMAQSLQGAAWLELGLAQKPDAVQNATTLLLRQSNQPERLLPPGTSIVQVYEEANHELLILGKPGVGKSTLLLQLAQHLVEQAEQDAARPLPVILPLSSWAVKRPLIQDWLGEQLSLIYDVPRQISREWVDQEQVLRLLDGLDEVEESARAACIAAINAYHREHLLPLVVCSRVVEYESAAVSERLALHSAVVVQPLTPEQIDLALVQASKPLTALRSTLRRNPTLRELASTPLMLSVLMLTYQGTSVRSLPQREAELQKQVWTDYVQRMVERKGDTRHYPLNVTCRWLGRLAQEMRQRNLTIFYLEQLRPDWLPKRQRFFYFWSVGLVFVLVFGLLGWLLDRHFTGLLTGLLSGSLLGLLFWGNGKIEPVEDLAWAWKGPLIGLGGGLVGGLLLGSLLGLLASFIGLVHGWFIGLAFGLAVGSVGGSVIGLIRGLAGAFSDKKLAERSSPTLNEGMRRSATNGLLLIPIGGLPFGLVGGLVGWLIRGPFAGLISGLIFWLAFGLITGLVGGLFAVVQHSFLRIWLWGTHLFPLHVPRFLEDARTRILLQRVGGGYSFAHRLLLDYFADLNPESASASKIPPTAMQTFQSTPPTSE